MVQSPHVLSFICRLLIIALSGIPAPTIFADVTDPNCESAYEGIHYCIEDDGDMHVVAIDLHNPHIRFEMVMADDVTSVDTTRRERIEEIVNRQPYEDQHVAVAINADYFGQRHGPEGLAVKNGRRLDADGGLGQNPNAIWRSSLTISRLNRVTLGRKSAEELEDPRAYRERFYNAVGGGPLILNYGVVIPNTVACLLERFPVGACRRKIQTAAGLSEDGRWLYLAVGEGRDIQGFARLLRDYGAFTAIKLDGGGSSQLWYDGEMRHDTDRAVGNALLVVHSPEPRHDGVFESLSELLVVEPGDEMEIGFTMENTGYLEWEPDLGYRFKNVFGWPVLGPAFQRLPQQVPAGSALESSWTIVAPQTPGVYEASWQLVRRSETIGSQLWFAVIVVPPGSDENGLTERIGRQLARARARQDFEQSWPGLRQEIEQEIWSIVKADLRSALNDADGRLRASIEAEVRAQWLPLLRYLAW